MKKLLLVFFVSLFTLASCTNTSNDDLWIEEQTFQSFGKIDTDSVSVRMVYESMRRQIRKQISKDMEVYMNEDDPSSNPHVVSGADYLQFLLSLPKNDIEEFCINNANEIIIEDNKSIQNEDMIKGTYSQNEIDWLYTFGDSYREHGGNSIKMICTYAENRPFPIKMSILYLGAILDEYGLCNSNSTSERVIGNICFERFKEEMDLHSARTTIDDIAIPLLEMGGGDIGSLIGVFVKGVDKYRTHKAVDNYNKCRMSTI